MTGTLLIIWGWLAFFNLAIRLTALYWVFHGKAGEDARWQYMTDARQFGGIPGYVAAAVAVGIVLAPVAFIASLPTVDKLWKRQP